MSDSNVFPPPSLVSEESVTVTPRAANSSRTNQETPPVQTPPVVAASVWQIPRFWVLTGLVLAASGLVASTLLWQKLGTIQEELARRSLDAGTQSIEARTLARQAQDGTRELAARLALQENRISEVSLQRSQLEELMQSLSRSRDENLVVDIESALRLAQQQAQLTGSAEPLVAALRSADQRLSRAAQPRLNPLQRAVVKDIERIRNASLTDVPALMIKLDELARLVDDLPVVNALVVNGQARMAASVSLNATTSTPATTTSSGSALVAPAASPVPRTAASAAAAVPGADASGSQLEKTWAKLLEKLSLSGLTQRVLGGVRDESRKLLRVSRIDYPEAALLSPEQSFFLRENLKLRLLNARLGLLSRQTESARSDLQNASVWMARYFDPASRRTQLASQLLQQVQSQLKTSELPRLDDTMSALTTAAAGR